MNKSKTIISLFLSVILVTGTIALSLLSFMIYVQAEPSYTNNYKSKDTTNVNIYKIKCINDNININGVNSGDVNAGNKDVTEERNLDAHSSDSNKGYYDDKKTFDCLISNKNTNTNIISIGSDGDNGNQTIPPTSPTPPEPTTAILTVTKTTNCQFGPVICGPINPQITVTGITPNPSSFLASQTPVDVTLSAGQYSVSEAGFIPNLPQCLNSQGGQNLSGPLYICTNFSADCSGDISAGQQLSCTIENTVINFD